MKVTVTSTAPTPQGLVLGLRIENERAGWIRFATTVLLASNLNYRECQMILNWLEDSRVPLERELDLAYEGGGGPDTPLEPRHW